MRTYLFSGLLFAVMLLPAAGCADGSWATAEKRWKEFTTYHYDMVKYLYYEGDEPLSSAIDHNLYRPFQREKNRILKKYLPDTRVYHHYHTLVLRKDGTILDVRQPREDGEDLEYHYHPDRERVDFADFVSRQHWQVHNEQDAYDMAEIYDTLNYWGGFHRSKYRKFEAEDMGDGTWRVERIYDDPPYVKLPPPSYYLVHVDRDGYVTDITDHMVTFKDQSNNHFKDALP